MKSLPTERGFKTAVGAALDRHFAALRATTEGRVAAMAILRLLNRLFHGPAYLSFVVMGLAAGGLALCSLNLLTLFQANINLLLTWGWMAAWDGGVVQLIELTFWGYLALAFYVVFKGCLEGLLTRIHQARK
jgi:hypothetical protein